MHCFIFILLAEITWESTRYYSKILINVYQIFDLGVYFQNVPRQPTNPPPPQNFVVAHFDAYSIFLIYETCNHVLRQIDGHPFLELFNETTEKQNDFFLEMLRNNASALFITFFEILNSEENNQQKIIQIFDR